MKIIGREDSEKKTAVCTSPLCTHAQASPRFSQNALRAGCSANTAHPSWGRWDAASSNSAPPSQASPLDVCALLLLVWLLPSKSLPWGSLISPVVWTKGSQPGARVTDSLLTCRAETQRA